MQSANCFNQSDKWRAINYFQIIIKTMDLLDYYYNYKKKCVHKINYIACSITIPSL